MGASSLRTLHRALEQFGNAYSDTMPKARSRTPRYLTGDEFYAAARSNIVLRLMDVYKIRADAAAVVATGGLDDLITKSCLDYDRAARKIYSSTRRGLLKRITLHALSIANCDIQKVAPMRVPSAALYSKMLTRDYALEDTDTVLFSELPKAVREQLQY